MFNSILNFDMLDTELSNILEVLAQYFPKSPVVILLFAVTIVYFFVFVTKCYTVAPSGAVACRV